MTVNELAKFLNENSEKSLSIFLTSSMTLVPSHFHVTEVGRVDKKFIDCGGTLRELSYCSLQVWTANDFDHRLEPLKLAKILRLANEKLDVGPLPVEFEYGSPASQHQLSYVDTTPTAIIFILAGKQTDCLAPDKCGINKCEGKGCC